MLFEDTYQTIAAPAEGQFRDRGSRFIAYAFPIKAEIEIKDILAKLKAEHTKAAHHCWAMRLTPDRSVYRVNDDGEPSGTAGRPILNVLLSKNVTNVLIIVVRYFGGKLLGVPGLIHAYKTAAEEALAVAPIIEQVSIDIYTILFDYAQMNEVMKVVKEERLKVLEQIADNRCKFKLALRKSSINKVLSRLENIKNIKAEYVLSC